jgi:hypothetical protein
MNIERFFVPPCITASSTFLVGILVMGVDPRLAFVTGLASGLAYVGIDYLIEKYLP